MSLKKTLLVATSLLLLAPIAVSAAEKKYPSEYELRRCVVAENCDVIESVCTGEYEPINLRHENKRKVKIKEERKSARCSKGKMVKAPGVLCIQNQCTLNVKK